jgi:hypothetical protein
MVYRGSLPLPVSLYNCHSFSNDTYCSCVGTYLTRVHVVKCTFMKYSFHNYGLKHSRHHTQDLKYLIHPKFIPVIPR